MFLKSSAHKIKLHNSRLKYIYSHMYLETGSCFNALEVDNDLCVCVRVCILRRLTDSASNNLTVIIPVAETESDF